MEEENFYCNRCEDNSNVDNFEKYSCARHGYYIRQADTSNLEIIKMFDCDRKRNERFAEKVVSYEQDVYEQKDGTVKLMEEEIGNLYDEEYAKKIQGVTAKNNTDEDKKMKRNKMNMIFRPSNNPAIIYLTNERDKMLHDELESCSWEQRYLLGYMMQNQSDRNEKEAIKAIHAKTRYQMDSQRKYVGVKMRNAVKNYDQGMPRWMLMD